MEIYSIPISTLLFLAPAVLTLPPAVNNPATLEEEGSKEDANSDNTAALEEEGPKEDSNKSEPTKRTCEDDPRNLNVETQQDEGMNATFPVTTMDVFRSVFNMKMESGEDSKPAKKRTKHGGMHTMIHTIMTI